MPASKIVDHQEVVRWIEEGRTYRWMVDEYDRKYNLSASQSMFSNFRRRHGLDRRLARNDVLIPWEVRPEHRWKYAIAMLRHEARMREGKPVAAGIPEKVQSWKQNLVDADAVVHYDPETEEGFFYVRRRPGIDLDLIREPEKRTTRRRAAD